MKKCFLITDSSVDHREMILWNLSSKTRLNFFSLNKFFFTLNYVIHEKYLKPRYFLSNNTIYMSQIDLMRWKELKPAKINKTTPLAKYRHNNITLKNIYTLETCV